jgi:hypothetical protein
MTRTHIVLVFFGVAFIAASPRAQSPVAFEVASVKPNTTDIARKQRLRTTRTRRTSRLYR